MVPRTRPTKARLSMKTVINVASPSPTHVPSSNATLPSSVVLCASDVRALLCQKRPISAHRPHQHMYHPEMLLCLRLWCYVQAMCEPYCFKSALCQPIDIANTCTIQQCYFAFVCGAMCKRCASPIVSKSHSVSPST